MRPKKPRPDSAALDRVIADSRRHQDARAADYREQALKLYPWVCGRCGRAFTHANLSELTVHHRNHNHDDNPADGTNWELLCLYCHDNEHQRQVEKARVVVPGARSAVATGKPFEDLKALLSRKE
jgi:hypothetical protein